MAANNANPPGAPEKRFSKRKRIIIPTTILVIVAIVIASYWYLYRRGYVSTNDAFIAGDPVTASSKILGRAVSLSAGEGGAVAEGQVLVRLDDTDLRALYTYSMGLVDVDRVTGRKMW